jgi:TRAP-type C4-dicarboxylate transport system substrate-binding protein
MKRITGILAGATIAACVALPASAQHNMRLGLATINDAQHAFAQKYAEELQKRTNNAIKVEVFPAAQLGNIPRMIENLKIGAQAGFVTPGGFFSGIDRNFELTDAPGIFKNFWHAQNAITAPEFRGKYLALGEKQGIVGVAVFNYGPTSIASLSPIRKLDDMKGLKIRVLATKMESKLASVLGMTGVPMPYPDVLPALQQRTIDGVRSSIAVMGASRFYTTTKYVTETESGMIIVGLFISKPWLSRLPKNLQDEVIKTGRDLELWGAQNAKTFNDNAAKVWRENGAEVIRLPEADQAELTKRLAPLGDEFLASDPATKDLYEILKKTLATASTEAPKS